MKNLIRRIGIWLGLVEPRWWDSVEADHVNVICGRHLLDALNHRRAC